ncbi:MAG: epimerase, partial [Phycisphaerae bacterium]
GLRRPILASPALVPYALARLMAPWLHDVTITREEIRGLMSDLLHVPDASAAGSTPLSSWAADHASTLGLHYASELARRRTTTS